MLIDPSRLRTKPKPTHCPSLTALDIHDSFETTAAVALSPLVDQDNGFSPDAKDRLLSLLNHYAYFALRADAYEGKGDEGLRWKKDAGCALSQVNQELKKYGTRVGFVGRRLLNDFDRQRRSLKPAELGI